MSAARSSLYRRASLLAAAFFGFASFSLAQTVAHAIPEAKSTKSTTTYGTTLSDVSHDRGVRIHRFHREHDDHERWTRGTVSGFRSFHIGCCHVPAGGSRDRSLRARGMRHELDDGHRIDAVELHRRSLCLCSRRPCPTASDAREWALRREPRPSTICPATTSSRSISGRLTARRSSAPCASITSSRSAPDRRSRRSPTPTTSPQFKFVEALFAAGITAGCGGGNYCPDNPVTRGQMAVFLASALGLHFPN